MQPFIDWTSVTPDDFEEMCHELLGALGYVNRLWYRGPGDRGRDITASLERKDIPGQTRLETCVVECKRITAGAVTPDDLRRSLDWAEIHRPDVFMIMTTSWLTPNTKDWLTGIETSRHLRIQILEGPDLEALMRRSFVPHYNFCLQKQFGDVQGGRLELTSRLSDAIAGDHVDPDPVVVAQALEDAGLIEDFRVAGDNLPPGAGTVSVTELHRVEYDANAMSRTTYQVKAISVSPFPVVFDRFRLFADIPVLDNAALNLTSVGLNDNLDSAVQIPFDTGNEKLVDLYLSEPALTLRPFDYSFEFDWPTPQPLEGLRHYVAVGRRPKVAVRVEMVVPSGFAITNHIVLHHQDGTCYRVRDGIALLPPFDTLRIDFGPLQLDAMLQVIFLVQHTPTGEVAAQ